MSTLPQRAINDVHDAIRPINPLSSASGRRTSAVVNPLFDMTERRKRRDRAAAQGFELFLHQQAFDEIIDRLKDVARPFSRALLIGCPDPEWPRRLAALVPDVVVLDPSPALAAQAGAHPMEEAEVAAWGDAQFDLVIAAGTLHSVDALPQALVGIRRILRPDSLFIGAIVGGDSLPALRQAMRAAESATGRGASPRVHPRIEPGAMATLLGKAGLVMPVVDVDRLFIRYSNLGKLVRDLRRTGETNIVCGRDRKPFGRAGLRAAEQAFADMAGGSGKTREQIDLLYFAAWTPAG